MGLNIICRRLNLDPDQILNLGRENDDKIPKDSKTRIKVLLNEYVQQGKLGEAKKIYASLRSFLDSHEAAVVFARQERIHYRRKKTANVRSPKESNRRCGQYSR
jgi:hypothetical protein